MGPIQRVPSSFLVALVLVAGCAAATPTATPTTPPIAAPTPTKAPTATPTKRPLVKAIIATSSTSLSFMVPFIGLAKGYWPEEGLDVEWVAAGGGAKALAAVVGNSADFAINSVAPEVLRAIAQGQPLRTVAAIQLRSGVTVVLRKSIADRYGLTEKSSLAEKGRALKGLNIASFSAGGSSYRLLQILFQEANIDPERDLTVTFIGNDAALIAAFRQGQIDAYSQSPPASAEPVATGDAVVLISMARKGDVPGLGDALGTALVVQKSTVDSRRDIAEAAVRAIWRSQKAFHDDRADAVKALRTLEFYKDIDAKTVEISLDILSGAVPKQPTTSQSQFEEILNFHNAGEAKAEDRLSLRFDQVVDNGPAEAAKKQLGF